MLVDSHAHIHFDDYANDLDEIFKHAFEKQVRAIITIGTNEHDSVRAVEFIKTHQPEGLKLFATVGLHPHDAKNGQSALNSLKILLETNTTDVVAVGECGLDYYRDLSDKADQATALRFQIELALTHKLPLVFHVRDAWEDFFIVLKDYPAIRGVIHSFTGGPRDVEAGMKHGLSFALNGIITFTKLESQLEAARLIPIEKLVLETDCPYLSPQPLRGRRDEPANIALTAEFLAAHRQLPIEQISRTTSQNANQLFGLGLDFQSE